jgi:hypothetical protein
MPDEQNPNTAPLSRDEVFAEMELAATDPAHPMFKARAAGLSRYDEWAESLYKRIPGMTGTVDLTNDIKVVDEATEKVAHEELRKGVAEAITKRGLDAAAVEAEGAKLFGGTAGMEVLDLLNERTLSGLAPSALPEAHVQMAQWMADLAQLRSAGPSGEADEIDAADFQSRYVSALVDQGINPQTLDATIAGIFAGRDDLYRHFIGQLNAFPPSQRLAAYVRSAQAVMNYVQLRQYVA